MLPSVILLYLLCLRQLPTLSVLSDLLTDGQLGLLLGTEFGLPGINASFDHVIVGGGTARLALATNLAEDPFITVAVIGAGGFYEIDNGDVGIVPGSTTW